MFLFKFFLGLVQYALVEVYDVLLLFVPQLCSDSHLLIKDFLNVAYPVKVVLLLLAKFLLMKVLAKLLDLAPFIITDVRRKIFNSNLARVRSSTLNWSFWIVKNSTTFTSLVLRNRSVLIRS